jgi:hypothetical protein
MPTNVFNHDNRRRRERQLLDQLHGLRVGCDGVVARHFALDLVGYAQLVDTPQHVLRDCHRVLTGFICDRHPNGGYSGGCAPARRESNFNTATAAASKATQQAVEHASWAAKK